MENSRSDSAGLPRCLALEDAPRGLKRSGGVLRQPQGERRELIGISAAGQDGVPEVGPKPRQGGAERRLAQVKPLRRPRHAPLRDEGIQRDQQVQVKPGKQDMVRHGGHSFNGELGQRPVYQRHRYLR